MNFMQININESGDLCSSIRNSDDSLSQVEEVEENSKFFSQKNEF